MTAIFPHSQGNGHANGHGNGNGNGHGHGNGNGNGHGHGNGNGNADDGVTQRGLSDSDDDGSIVQDDGKCYHSNKMTL